MTLTTSVPTYVISTSDRWRSRVEHFLARSQFDVVLSVSDFKAVRSAHLAHRGPPLLLIDASLRHSRACRAIKVFQNAHPGGRGVAFVDHYLPQNLLSAYQDGVSGYLLSSTTREVLLVSLSLVMTGEFMMSPPALDALPSVPPTKANGFDFPVPRIDGDGPLPHGLSSRETSVLEGLMNGDSNKAIARNCSLTEGTVKSHIRSIMRKIQVQNRTQAATWAAQNLFRAGREGSGRQH